MGEDFVQFLRGLCLNGSIEKLIIPGGNFIFKNIFGILMTFFTNNQAFESLHVSDPMGWGVTDMGSVIASAIGRFYSFWKNILSNWDSQEQAGGIIEALIGHSGLKRTHGIGQNLDTLSRRYPIWWRRGNNFGKWSCNQFHVQWTVHFRHQWRWLLFRHGKWMACNRICFV